MDFFAHQDRARRQTAPDAGPVRGGGGGHHRRALQGAGLPAALQGPADRISTRSCLGIVAAAVLTLIGLGSLYKIRQLRRAGARRWPSCWGGGWWRAGRGPTATSSGSSTWSRRWPSPRASRSPPSTSWTRTGSTPSPPGYTTADAVVTVTRGCLRKLTRDELQGVIAHEFSHILNGDMRLNIRLMGVVHGILLIALIGSDVLRVLVRRRPRAGPGPPGRAVRSSWSRGR